ncbi:hypothetical protein OUZ56_023050 [Daphnia magna]|uniref:Uncharacterized protein n=1 Tax=Daphnia magna TaxID=35525 RepID=A0ABR0AYB7_9CRUS|nr:hypothetical protein OUZ56_023050 [Daphnia magna]
MDDQATSDLKFLDNNIGKPVSDETSTPAASISLNNGRRSKRVELVEERRLKTDIRCKRGQKSPQPIYYLSHCGICHT